MAEITTLVLEKGLNLIASVDALPEGATPDCGNVEIGAGGVVETRGGSALNAITLPVAAGATRELYAMEEEGFPFTTPPSTPNASVAQLMFTGGQIYRTENTPSGVEGVVNLGAYTTPAGALVSKRPYGVHFTDSLTGASVTPYNITVFGSSAPLAIIAGSLAAPTAVTHADWTATNGYPNTCASYGGRMWYLGSDKFPARMWVTDVGKFGTFTVSLPVLPNESFILDLELTNGGEVIGAKHLFDLLLVFTTRGIYRIIPQSGTVPYKSVFVSNLVAVSQHSIVQVESAIYFMTRSGVYTSITALTYGDIKTEELSAALAPLFDTTAHWRLSGAFGTYDQNTEKLMFFFEHEFTFGRASAVAPAVTQAAALAELDAGRGIYPYEVTECLAFDLRGKSWQRHFFPMPIDFAVARDDGTGSVAIDAYSRTSTTNVNEHGLFTPGLNTDGALAITSYYRSKRDAYKSLSRRKTRFFPYARISAGAPTINASVDGAAFKPTQGRTIAAGINRRNIVGTGKDIQLEFVSNSYFRLDAYSTGVDAGGER